MNFVLRKACSPAHKQYVFISLRERARARACIRSDENQLAFEFICARERDKQKSRCKLILTLREMNMLHRVHCAPRYVRLLALRCKWLINRKFY